MFLLLIILIFIVAIFLSIYNRFYALLFLIPLSVYSQSASVISFGSRGINLGLDTIYIFFIIIIEMINFKKQKTKLYINNSGIILIFCFLYIFLNALISSIFSVKGISLSGILVFIRLFQYIPIFVIIYNTPIDFKKTLVILKVFVMTGVSTSLVAIYQFFSGNYTHMKGMPSFTIAIFRETLDTQIVPGSYGGSANYNIFAAFLLISYFLTILILKSKKEIVGYNKIKYLIYLLIILLGFYMAKSRAAIMAIILCFILFNFKLTKLTSSLKNIIVFILSIFFIGFFFKENILIKSFTDIILDFNEALPYAMEEANYDSSMGFSGDTLGAAVRVFSYLEAIRVFILYPVFGCGFDQFLSFSSHYPENLFLQILAETGLFGFILYSFFIFRLYKDAKKLPIENNFNKNYILAFQAIILSLIIVNLTGATLLIQKVWGPFLIISGFFFSYLRTSNNDKKLIFWK